MLSALFKHLRARGLVDSNPVPGTEPPVDKKLKRAQERTRSLTDSELAIARLFMVELAHFPELGKSLWKAVEDEQGESMIEYFRSHQRKRNIRPLNLNLLAELFLFNIYSFTNRVALHQRDKPAAEELEAYIDNMIDVMVGGIAL